MNEKYILCIKINSKWVQIGEKEECYADIEKFKREVDTKLNGVTSICKVIYYSMNTNE